MSDAISAFHFLRPMWLLGLLAIAAIWYLIRPRKVAATQDNATIAPHLLEALRVGSGQSRRVYPIDGAALTLVFLCLAASGPTWSRLSNPLIAETAPLVVALKVTPSMETPDLAPSRLDRARFKILDLIEQRAGARTALIAYSGSAHRVSPLIEDPNILRPLLEGLSPRVMPAEGDTPATALALAETILTDGDAPGAVLFVLDDFNPADVAAFEASDPDTPRPPIVVLVALPDRVSIPQLDRLSDVTTVRITPDDTDIREIERRLQSAHRAALLADDRLAWDDRGWWLIWPAALLCLLWFRRGWTMHWAILLATFMTLQTPQTARAEGVIDWFLTADQQGRMAFEDKEYSEAGELFQDPMWKGYAKMRAGQYEEAAQILSRIDTPEAAFAEGYARIRNRQYRDGARAFEKAELRQPGYPNAAKNAEIAWAIVTYVEDARDQSDTGEDTGVGADDVVYDNEDARGAVTTEERKPAKDAAPMTAQQWIDSIDTDMADFLRFRFVLEEAEAKK